MTTREVYSLCLGRAAARVSRSWTQGAYSRHSDGRALQTFGIRADAVDIVGALYHSAHELELPYEDFETLRYLVTAHLPSPYFADPDFGIERFNDATTTTVEDVISVLKATQEDYECAGVVQSLTRGALIAA